MLIRLTMSLQALDPIFPLKLPPLPLFRSEINKPLNIEACRSRQVVFSVLFENGAFQYNVQSTGEKTNVLHLSHALQDNMNDVSSL